MIGTLAVALALGAAPALDLGARLTRILAAEDAGRAAPGELEALLTDGQAGVRRRAALAAGRIGTPSLALPLIGLLGDREPEVRQMAAFALGLLADPSATTPLVAALKDPDTLVRARAAEALGRTGGPAAAKAVAEMVLAALPRGAPFITVRGDDPGSAADPWLELRLALFALAALKDAPAAEAVLLASGQPRFDWWAATYAAAAIHSAGLEPFLLQAARSTDPLSRAVAARGLAVFNDSAAVQQLAALTRDAQPAVALAALRALKATGSPEALPAAVRGLDAADWGLQEEALSALSALPADRNLREKVVAFVGHADPAVRTAAWRALAHIVPDELPLILSGTDLDPVWSVRAGLARALGAQRHAETVGLLFPMLQDSDSRVLPDVLEALRALRGPDSIDTLRRALGHTDPVVRAAAAQGLAGLKAPGGTAALEKAYELSKAGPDWGPRVLILEALAGQRDGPASEVLRRAATRDSSPEVRRQAAAILQRAGETPPDAPRAHWPRPPCDYRSALAAYGALRGSTVYTPRALLKTPKGVIEIHLNVIEAPLACLRFMTLARRGFYVGLPFHRVVPGQIVEAGCPRGDGRGGLGDRVRREIGQRPFGRGAVGLAIDGRDWTDTQFFITLSPMPELDGRRSLFGWVANGQDVVDRLRQEDVIEAIEIWD